MAGDRTAVIKLAWTNSITLGLHIAFSRTWGLEGLEALVVGRAYGDDLYTWRGGRRDRKKALRGGLK